jgi:hypothetical protein
MESFEKIEPIKKDLFEKLLLSKAFWSYSSVSLEQQMSDEFLIEKVLLHLIMIDRMVQKTCDV